MIDPIALIGAIVSAATAAGQGLKYLYDNRKGIATSVTTAARTNHNRVTAKEHHAKCQERISELELFLRTNPKAKRSQLISAEIDALMAYAAAVKTAFSAWQWAVDAQVALLHSPHNVMLMAVLKNETASRKYRLKGLSAPASPHAVLTQDFYQAFAIARPVSPRAYHTIHFRYTGVLVTHGFPLLLHYRPSPRPKRKP